MLSHLYSRKPPLKMKPEGAKQEIDIINSFYEERKSRSISGKQHNLLRKNISFFYQQTDQQNNLNDSNQILNRKNSMFDGNSIDPLSLKNSNSSQFNQSSCNIDLKRTRNNPSLPQIQLNQNRSQHSLSCSSKLNVLKGDLTDSQYREQLKKQLSKRVNIKSYLSDLSIYQNTMNQTNKMKFFNQEVQNNYKRQINRNDYYQFDTTGQKQRVQQYHEKQQFYGKQIEKADKLDSYQEGFKNNNQIKHSRKISEEQRSKEIQFSKNQITDRTQVNRHTFGSQNSSKHNHSLLSQDSAKRSNNQSNKKSEKQTKVNLLNSQQLSQLQYNSHPLRQVQSQNPKPPLPLKLKYNYFDHEQQANYKRRIQELQNELQQTKAKQKRQQKFIQSISKMMRTIQGKQMDEQYSLKQLWRWIKQLPNKKY